MTTVIGMTAPRNIGVATSRPSTPASTLMAGERTPHPTDRKQLRADGSYLGEI